MAGIREELTLVDKFTNVFNRFINLGNQAAGQATAVEAGNNRMTAAADNAAKSFTRSGENLAFYQKMLQETERRMDSLTSKLYFAEVVPDGSRRQQRNIDAWRKQTDLLEAEQQRLKSAIAAATGEAVNLAPNIQKAVEPTRNVHNEFRSMVGTIVKITALLGGLMAGKKFLELGFKTDSYERMFESRLGDQQVGAAAFQHYKDMADKNGFKYEDVMQGVMSFMGMTSNPHQLDALTMLAKRMSVFDTQGQGLKGAQFSLQEAMAGNFQSLHRRFSIGTGMIKAAGVEDAAKAGDMDKFIQGMEKLFAMRNMSEEAFNNLMKSPQRQLETFENRWHNSMASMAQAVILRMLPALTMLSDALASPAGQMFMSMLANTIGFAAWGVLMLANGFIGLMQILEPLIPALEIVFYTLLITGAVKAAMALWAMIPPLLTQLAVWGIMNLPILAVVGIIVTLLALFLKFPEVLGIVTGTVYAFGTAFVNIIKMVCNQFTGLYNLISDGLSKLTLGNMSLGHIAPLEYGNIGYNYQKGKAWGTELATKAGDYLSGIVPKMPTMPTAPFDNFPGSTEIPNVDKVKHVGKIHEPVKLSNEDLKMLLDLADRDYVNKINMTQLTPEVHVHVDTGGGDVDAEQVADRIKHMLIEQAASSTNLAYGG